MEILKCHPTFLPRFPTKRQHKRHIPQFLLNQWQKLIKELYFKYLKKVRSGSMALVLGKSKSKVIYCFGFLRVLKQQTLKNFSLNLTFQLTTFWRGLYGLSSQNRGNKPFSKKLSIDTSYLQKDKWDSIGSMDRFPTKSRKQILFEKALRFAKGKVGFYRVYDIGSLQN